jgi:putative SOS response-associated peptidase YedK
MCFHSQQSKDAQTLEKRFKAKFVDAAQYQPSIYNGFAFPFTPVITSLHFEEIQLFSWGLMPSWAKNIDFRKNTLNAKVETIAEKPSFKNIQNQRCLVLLDAFFEWQWLDSLGKKKQKYCIELPDASPFALAGLWSTWSDPLTDTLWNTYTILTTDANEQMSQIHNSKKRMPMILTPEEESIWLQNGKISLERNVELKTTPV